MDSGFYTWLASALNDVAVKLVNFLVDIVNALIVALVAIITTIAGMLPAGSSLPALPSLPDGSTWTAFVTTLNWLFPMQFIVSCFTFVTGAIIAYVVIAPLARWAKLLR